MFIFLLKVNEDITHWYSVFMINMLFVMVHFFPWFKLSGFICNNNNNNNNNNKMMMIFTEEAPSHGKWFSGRTPD